MKVRSEENLADAFTKAVDREGIIKHLEGISARVSWDRHPLTPKTDYEAGRSEEWQDRANE